MTADAANVSLYERYCFIHFALVTERNHLEEQLPIAEADRATAAQEKTALMRSITLRSGTPLMRHELLAHYAADFAEFERRAAVPNAIKARLAELGPLIQQADRNKRRHAPPLGNPWGVSR